MKLALLAFLSVICLGGIFYLVGLGKSKERAKRLEKDIEEAKKDVYIEKKQSDILANRSEYNLFKRLRKGDF